LLYETELFGNELSLKLGQGKQFIAHIKQKITNIKDQSFDPDYKFSKELLNSFRVNINTNLKQKVTQLIKYINSYEAQKPDLKLYRKQQHNVKNSDFFFIIDTLEKAYWFGFLCADGSIQYVTPESGRRVRYRVYIQLGYKDKAQLIKFCNAIGYDSTKISERYTNLHYKNEIKQFKSVVIQFICKEMVEDLVNNDFASSNADYKTLPSFLKKNKNLLLAFILGYFDGDGSKKRRGGGLIFCSNEPFLKEIRDAVNNLLGIELNVILTQNKDEILQTPNFCFKEGSEDGYTIKLTKNAYKLTISSVLYKMMMINYKNSMKRKRLDYQKNSLSLSELKHKLNSKEVLNSLVTHFSISEISSYFGVNAKMIESLCNDWDIDAFN